MNISTKELKTLQGASVIQPLTLGDIQTEGFILTPNDTDQVAKLLYLANQENTPLALRFDDALLIENPLWMNLKNLNKIRNYRKKDLIITIETGISMGELKKELNANGHQFPLSYPDEMLLADLIAQDRPAPESGFYGFPRDYVLGLEMVTPDGLITHYGGEVVKNVTGYDLNKFYTGSHHALGVITAISLKLLAKPKTNKSWIFKSKSPEFTVLQLQELLPLIHSKRWPLRVCELFELPKEKGWELWLSASANTDKFLDQLESDIKKTLKQSLSEQLTLSKTTRQDRHEEAQLDHSHVISIAVPKGAQSIAQSLQAIQSAFSKSCGAKPQIQIRLAAGLIFLTWPTGAVPQLKDLEKPLKQLGQNIHENDGQIQLWDFSSEFSALSRHFNFPQETLTRYLMDKLKKQYDPKHLLFSRHLPFLKPIKKENP